MTILYEGRTGTGAGTLETLVDGRQAVGVALTLDDRWQLTVDSGVILATADVPPPNARPEGMTAAVEIQPDGEVVVAKAPAAGLAPPEPARSVRRCQ
ncbi:MAG: hypothetical protein ABR509_08605 [Candidatus Limnocylindria bacterium]